MTIFGETLKKDDCVSNRLFGAGGGGRTRTLSPGTDFESVTSADSITPALSYYNTLRTILQEVTQKKLVNEKFIVG